MAQVPATPKALRWRRLSVARVLGPKAALRGARLVQSEREALNLRDAAPVTAPPADPAITFLLPLVGRHHVRDWAEVSARLSDTLASFRGQSDPDWQALITGQDAPDLPPEIANDPRIRFLPFNEPVEGNDKWAKLGRLCAALPDHVTRDGYVMPFDADDILARDAVKGMRAGGAVGGYVVESGLVRDWATGETASTRPQSLLHPFQRAFWKLCGSCAAFRWRPSDGPGFLAALTAHEHRMFPYLAALAGRPLRPLRDPTVLYVVNHGENFGARRGRVSFKTRFVARYALPPGPERDAALARFDQNAAPKEKDPT